MYVRIDDVCVCVCALEYDETTLDAIARRIFPNDGRCSKFLFMTAIKIQFQSSCVCLFVGLVELCLLAGVGR